MVDWATLGQCVSVCRLVSQLNCKTTRSLMFVADVNKTSKLFAYWNGGAMPVVRSLRCYDVVLHVLPPSFVRHPFQSVGGPCLLMLRTRVSIILLLFVVTYVVCRQFVGALRQPVLSD